MTLLSYTYNPVNGDPEDIGQIMANFNAVKAVVNGSLDNTNIANGAAIDLAKIAQNGATNGQVPVWNQAAGKWIPGTVGGGGGGTPGFITHDLLTADAVIAGSAINEGTATTIKSSTSKSYSGTGIYIVEFWSPRAAQNGAASFILMLLRDSTVLAGTFGLVDGNANKLPISLRYRDVNPPAGNHVYTVKGYASSGSGGTISGGNGGSGNNAPGFIRVTQES